MAKTAQMTGTDLFSFLTTGEASHLAMVRQSRKDVWGAAIKIGASSLDDCSPRMLTLNPSRKNARYPMLMDNNFWTVLLHPV